MTCSNTCRAQNFNKNYCEDNFKTSLEDFLYNFKASTVFTDLPRCKDNEPQCVPWDMHYLVKSN